MDVETNSQPRVNSARLGDYVGRIVRLACKVERVLQSSFFSGIDIVLTRFLRLRLDSGKRHLRYRARLRPRTD